MVKQQEKEVGGGGEAHCPPHPCHHRGTCRAVAGDRHARAERAGGAAAHQSSDPAPGSGSCPGAWLSRQRLCSRHSIRPVRKHRARQSLLGQYLPNELLHGLTQAIADKDLHLVLTQVPDAVIEEETYLPHTMRDLSVDGVLINRHVGPTLPYLERIRRLRIPAAFLNVKQEFDCVYPDDLAGGRMAAELLLRLGHERIAYVDTEERENKHYSKEDRRSGYEQAMLSAGKSPRLYFLPKDWQVAGKPSTDQRVEAARRLLARHDRPTAVIAYELARRWRWSAPRMSFVCGYRKTFPSSSSTTGLTTVFLSPSTP
jgi:hypothetical protein